jgi:predicted AlkP superfamily phosphohydrolase/phosphomutase
MWGPLESTAPPITVPAWSCMLSGRTPGELGVYGFRNRRDHGYDQLAFATSRAIRVPRLWDLLGQAGRESVVLGVPGTYPPPRVRGSLVSCFLAPSTDAQFTFPPELRQEVQRVTGGYTLDVADFRTKDKDRIAQELFDMTEQRFALARHLATTRPWDFLAFVDMGPDRLHHGFWQHCVPDHPKYRPGNPYAHVFRDYYRAVDRHLADFLEVLPDGTTVLVVSDHGGQAMVGWSRTAAWGDGGYYGRLFLNVEGREPQGTVPAADYETVRDQLIDSLEGLVDHLGRPMGTRAFRPEELYPEVRGVAPDLIVYFGDLRWRAVGSLGLGQGLYTFDNDTGPDDANHADQGVFVLAGDGLPTGRRDDLSIYDMAPTLQSLFRLPAPPGQRGRVLA